MPAWTNVHKEKEETLLLKDIYDPAGRLRSVVMPNGQVFPLYYLYDLESVFSSALQSKV